MGRAGRCGRFVDKWLEGLSVRDESVLRLRAADVRGGSVAAIAQCRTLVLPSG